MINIDMDIAEYIAWYLIGPDKMDEWRERLPQRPDWQMAVERVREILKERGQ